MSRPDSEALRLEKLWGGEFGHDYVARNANAAEGREPFWSTTLKEFPAKRVLEVGCNLGGNLRWIAKTVEPRQVFGVDVNEKALTELRAAVPGVNAITAEARNLPFRDGWFDLVFTSGVLIHQPPDTLPLVMSEIVRCSRRWVLCAEYFSAEPTEVAYRGQTGALFKRDFGGDYARLFPELVLKKQGFLKKEDGWDDVTFWIFEKSSP